MDDDDRLQSTAHAAILEHARRFTLHYRLRTIVDDEDGAYLEELVLAGSAMEAELGACDEQGDLKRVNELRAYLGRNYEIQEATVRRIHQQHGHLFVGRRGRAPRVSRAPEPPVRCAASRRSPRQRRRRATSKPASSSSGDPGGDGPPDAAPSSRGGAS